MPNNAFNIMNTQKKKDVSPAKIRIEVLTLLSKASDCELQWGEIRQKIFVKFADKESLEHPYREKSINNTLDRVLKDIRLDELIDVKGPPKKRVYFIRKNKQQKIKETLQKQDVVNLLDLASSEELNDLSRFLFELPTLYIDSSKYINYEDFKKSNPLDNPTPEREEALHNHFKAFYDKEKLIKEMNKATLILVNLKAQKEKS